MYLSAKNDSERIEELSDLLEIIHALAEVHNSSFVEVDIDGKKGKNRGGFKDRIFLIEVEDK